MTEDWHRTFIDLEEDRDTWRLRAHLLGDTLHTLLVVNCLRPELKRAVRLALSDANYPGYE